MILPLLALLLQADKPVHVWLDVPSPLARGVPVRVYVQVATEGNLVVLQRRTDGRIGVLFPSSPTGTPFVRAGTYEIRGPSNRPAFVVAEPDGQGMILAALTTDPMRFHEFVRAADWNPDALVPSWGNADAEGALTDIVQRMLGAGTFNYDLVTYTVAPAPAVYAQQESAPGYAPYSTCVGCTFIGTEIVLAEPFFGCDAFFDVCFGFPHVRPKPPQPAANPPARFLALNLRPRTGPMPADVLIPKSGGSNPAIEPRPRPRPRVAPSTPAAVAVQAVTPPLRHVRYTRLSNPNAGESGAPGGAAVAVSRGAVVVPAAGASVRVAPRSRAAVWTGRRTGETGGTARAIVPAQTSQAAPVTAPRARSTASASATTQGTRGIALPSARSYTTGSRAGVARAGVARQ